jgi:hypothetical protein
VTSSTVAAIAVSGSNPKLALPLDGLSAAALAQDFASTIQILLLRSKKF